MEEDYKLIDSGDGVKVEKFGPYIFERPCSQAIWHRQTRVKADAVFTRVEGDGKWTFHKKFPKTWTITVAGVKMLIKPTDFGHLGIFPEHAAHWHLQGESVLNLFAYTGGYSLAASQNGCLVTHVDASKGIVSWARENADLNDISNVRWIVDDAYKYCKREVKRGNTYDGIILDPPSFGRGASGQVFKIEEDLLPLLELFKDLISKQGWVMLSCHTPGFGPGVLSRLLETTLPKGTIESGEMLTGNLPLGNYARWHAHK
ncbi:MAG: Ribosomal RNA large subunit methyltransferase K/L [Chlamydiia bacterium]|nr:Ribosomal RNA large subunit methyltransferase K/L [Chlamydiia bacterium]MCH9616155.1 Ribosomal RNA large subunit methyltransferase K/L [Chlamydiia bacterium]MCH9629859.1 Ribosomal RNA large subunit methyltransferase K/L [Chlamydiia bacterium]